MVTLLLGPDFRRLWEEAHRLVPAGLHRFVIEKLTAESARQVIRLDRPGRTFIIGLDGSVEAVQHMLLKTLEEPRGSFVLVSTAAPLPTVMSRCSQVLRYGSGPQEPPSDAGRAAAAVSMAMRAVHDRDRTALARTLRLWDEAAHSALLEWAVACACDRWEPPLAIPQGCSFTPAFGRELLLRLAEAGTARPRLSAQVVLERMLDR